MKQIQISKDVFPLGVFKTKASGILKQLRQSQRPVVITQNGTPAAVLMTPESYDSLVETQQFILAIREGLEDERAGRVVSDVELTHELDREFGKMDAK